MKNCIPFDEMRSRCRVALKAHGIKTSTVYDYQRSLAPLISYMEAKGIKSYTSTLGEEFAMTLKYDSGMSCNKRNDVYKVIKLLNFILGEGASPLIRPARIRYEYAEVFRETIERFLQKMETLGRSSNTLACYKHGLSQFSIRMALEKLTPNTLSREKIVQFFENNPIGKRGSTVSAVKFYCMFLHSEGILQDDLEGFFGRFGKRGPKRLLSYYSPEEITKIESAIDRNTDTGKRDYAMILMATRLGLRSSDVRDLKFSNINWDTNEICLVQYKTKQTITLPLLRDVGEAIIAYIKNGRPQSSSKCVFISHNFPYDRIQMEHFHQMVTKYIRKAEVNDNDRHHGPHALRHSLATAMLNNGESLHVISEVLGHTSTVSTEDYLTVNVPNLLICSLDVPIVDENFYHQGGGLFYDYD